MYQTLSNFVAYLLFSISVLANSSILNTEQLEAALKNTHLVLKGTLNESQQIARFKNSQYVTENPVENASAIYLGMLASEKVIIHKQDDAKISDKIGIVWFDTISLTGKEYAAKLPSRMCPPITAHAYSKNPRIWFLQYDHGIWRLVSDHPLNLEKHIDEYLRTGTAKTLDARYKESTEKPHKDDPFQD